MARAEQRHSLYDPRFEHDACGVGFVAATTRADRERVLPLALAGLSGLSHRGAFAADGESSDGAGVALPLEPALLKRIFPSLRGHPAIAMLFLPSDPGQAVRARRLVSRSLAAEGLSVAAWRTVPVDEGAIGEEARSSRPLIEQAVIFGRGGRAPRQKSLLLARRRMELTAARAGLSGFAVVSASSKSIVYKALAAGSRLPEFFPDLNAQLPLSYAVFHQRYATNTTPTWALAQPFRLISHNGEINTVRANREELRGRRADLGGDFGRRLFELGELLTTIGSTRCPSTRRWTCSARPAGRSRRPCCWPFPRRSTCARPRCRSLARFGNEPPACWRRGTARQRSSSPTAGGWACSLIATACGRRRSRSRIAASSRSRRKRVPCR